MGLPVPSAEESDRYCQLKENFADPTMLEIAPFRVPQMVAISLDSVSLLDVKFAQECPIAEPSGRRVL